MKSSDISVQNGTAVIQFFWDIHPDSPSKCLAKLGEPELKE
jgi:hypothetical protein